MRFESVKAYAFGPFRNESLELAPGMNVVYGPNEAGKSSWRAALYAGLCGMRRTRGRAFSFLGGVPWSIVYDNTTLAVARILGDGRRKRTRVFSELVSHYLFEDRFGRPGKGNDKGKVEGLVGYARRNFLVPVPSFASFDELNGYLEQRCLERLGPTESHRPGPRLSSPACCPADPAPAPLPRTAIGAPNGNQRPPPAPFIRIELGPSPPTALTPCSNPKAAPHRWIRAKAPRRYSKESSLFHHDNRAETQDD